MHAGNGCPCKAAGLSGNCTRRHTPGAWWISRAILSRTTSPLPRSSRQFRSGHSQECDLLQTWTPAATSLSAALMAWADPSRSIWGLR